MADTNTAAAAAQDVQVATKTEVTLTFDMTDGTQKTVTFDVPNGAAGATIQSATPTTQQVTNEDGSTSTEVTLVLGMSDGTTVTVPGFDVPNGKDGSDAIVTEKTILATPTNPTATLGEAVDKAFAAIPETEKGAPSGVQALDADGAIATFTFTESTSGSGRLTITGAGTAVVTVTGNGITSTKSLGELLGDFMATTVSLSDQTASIDNKVCELSPDGAMYAGKVAGDASQAATNNDTYKTVGSLATIAVAHDTEIASINEVTAAHATDISGNTTKILALQRQITDLAAVEQELETIQDVLTSTATQGATNASDITALDTKTADLSTDGSTYSGKVTGDVSQAATGMKTTGGDLVTVADVAQTANSALQPQNGSVSSLAFNCIVNSTAVAAGTAAINIQAEGTKLEISQNTAFVATTMLAVPTSPTDEGALGELRFDYTSGMMYYCITAGAAGAAKWVRFPIDTTWVSLG